MSQRVVMQVLECRAKHGGVYDQARIDFIDGLRQALQIKSSSSVTLKSKVPMNLGTFNLAISRLSKAASSFAPDTKVLVDKDALAIADAVRDFLILSLTNEHFELLGLKQDRFIEGHINKLTSKLNNFGVELDPASDQFDLLVEKKVIDASTAVASFGANTKCIEVPLLSEMITVVSDYQFYQKLRVKAPEKFTAPEAAMTAYAKKHRLALRLTSNALLSEEERSKKREKREVNFGLLKKFTFKAKREN